MATDAVGSPGILVGDSAAAARWRRRRTLNAWGWRGFLAFVGLMLFGPLVILVLFSFNDSNILSFPLEGFTRSAQRASPYCFQAESAKAS